MLDPTAAVEPVAFAELPPLEPAEDPTAFFVEPKVAEPAGELESVVGLAVELASPKAPCRVACDPHAHSTIAAASTTARTAMRAEILLDIRTRGAV